MSNELWKLSSQEYEDLLKSGEFFDTEILVGEEPDTKVFQLHSLVLKVRSPYFRTALSSNWVKIEDNIIKFQKSNISVEIFDILIKYIYSSIIDLTIYDVRTNIALLVAADELCLNGICAYIEDYLLKDEDLLRRNFVLFQETVTQFDHFKKLSQYYNIINQQDSSLIFKASDFTTIKQEALVDILMKNDHPLRPIDVWDKVMEWCIARSDELTSETETESWTTDHITTFGTLILPFLPYIKFEKMRSIDFFKKIKSFKNIFDDKFYIKILEDYSFNNIYSELPNTSQAENGLDSKIINLNDAVFISNWIKTIKKHPKEFKYEFNLLFRGSRDGFHADIFHECCDNKGPTVTIALVKNTDEILGGFNPLSWKSNNSVSVIGESFIFSLDRKYLDNSIFSKVENEASLSANHEGWGPNFGVSNVNEGDLKLYGDKKGACFRKAYEKLIRKEQGKFDIEEYEVFQVTGKFDRTPINF